MDDGLSVSDTVTAALVDAPVVVVRPRPIWARPGPVWAASFVVVGRRMGGRTLSRPGPSALAAPLVSRAARRVPGGCAYGHA